MDARSVDLFELLYDADLQRYYERIRLALHVSRPEQLDLVPDERLVALGMARPELRRLRKVCATRPSRTRAYLSRLRRLLAPPPPPSPPSPLVPPTNGHIIPAERIKLHKELGSGEFGLVQQGVWSDAGRRVQVAVKRLYPERMRANALDFLKEAAIMHGIEHERVVRLYGVALGPRELMLVTELAPLRSLLECLKDAPSRSNFTVTTLCDFAEQICDGMAYLERERLIHRDLAARNVLVFSKNEVKISDFGLSRALGAGEDYYRTNFNVNLKLPIAWCAPECIGYLRFTSSSDVWAYAVTLWETFSYGFQPWAGFSGRQILAAIDAPNHQRLERPECCPEDYYRLMLECWRHEPSARPKFSDVLVALPDRRPERVRASSSSDADPNANSPDRLRYDAGDVITVLEKGPARWRGVSDDGSTGYFDPTNTVSFFGANLPDSGSKDKRSRSAGEVDSGTKRLFARNDRRRSTASRRRLRSDMISAPQGDVKHTGHVGLDGAYFGDISSIEYSSVPKQPAVPYRPNEDLEQIPLINPNSPSHLTGNCDSPSMHSLLGVASDTSKSVLLERAPYDVTDGCASRRDRPCGSSMHRTESAKCERTSAFNFDASTIRKCSSVFKWGKKKETKMDSLIIDLNESHRNDRESHDSANTAETVAHDYQEISDNEDEQKTSDFSQSLLDEMESMFRSYSESSKHFTPKSDSVNTSSKNDIVELGTKFISCNLGTKKKQTVKPISAHDQRTLDSAIALAHKISEKSMTTLDRNETPKTPSSPAERSKFSFFFPIGGSLSHGSNSLKGSDAFSSKMEKRSFSQEAQSVPDIQTNLTEESKLAYKSLIEQPCRLETTLLKIKNKQFTPLQLNLNVHGHDFKNSNSILDKNSLVGNKKNIDEQNLKLESIKTSVSNNVMPMSKVESLTHHNESFSPLKSKDSKQDVKDADTRNIIHVDKTENIKPQNLLPVPPRDPTKSFDAGKRHVRKYPLIIHTSTEESETISEKQVNLEFEKLETSFSETEQRVHNNNTDNHFTFSESNSSLKGAFNETSTNFSNIVETNNLFHSTNPFDAPSLNFEAQIENDFSMQDCCDGIQQNINFDIFSKPQIDLSPFIKCNILNSDDCEIGIKIDNTSGIPVSINSNDISFIDDTPNDVFNIFTTKTSGNFLMDKNLFDNKSDDQQFDDIETNELMEHSPDRVSVEDLLEFADQKPCGRQRGADSDEVRIMCKVLNQQMSPETCLLALELASWNVHRAIKLAKLKLMGLENCTLYDCSLALKECEWDVARAASLLADSTDITLV